MRRDDAKPCPFCGCTAITIIQISNYYRAKCGGCEAGTAFAESEPAALARWNTRKSDDAFLAEISKQGVIEFAAAMAAIHAECQAGGYFDRQVKVYAKAQELAESYLKQRCGEKTA
ncbi:Lar family restriction alleviation protein [Atlantibacter hermannii]|uniref:Lar family restriction alleviation protein n=1 Tax=Atlantibacter hermannii TaxID=565 RepID=UPI0028AB6EE4|nr:Lar family restriction alleviation protein [Atlantibacter hermannii]